MKKPSPPCRLAVTQPGTTYYSVKRFMGQQLSDTKDLASLVSTESPVFPACLKLGLSNEVPAASPKQGIENTYSACCSAKTHTLQRIKHSFPEALTEIKDSLCNSNWVRKCGDPFQGAIP